MYINKIRTKFRKTSIEILEEEKGVEPAIHNDQEKIKAGDTKGVFIDKYAGTYAVDERDLKSPDNWIPRYPEMVRLTGLHPFNSEAPIKKLMDAGFITPLSLHYTRNHGAVPKLEWDTHTIEFTGEGFKSQVLNMNHIYNNYEHETFPITMTCAGNRRKEENMTKKTIGFSWNTSAHSTSVWTGVLLRDVLLDIGVPWASRGRRTEEEQRHVWFSGAEDLPNGKYGTSLPLGYVMNEANDVMLAFEQNGKRLLPDRGFPVRVLIPGYIGGRMVKWLKKIEIRTKPSDNWYHFFDNRILPSHVDKALADKEKWWFKEEYLFNQLNINSAITSPMHDEQFSFANGSKLTFKGYAYCGAGHKITRVEITTNGGKSWKLCNLKVTEKPNRFGKYWCWVFWDINVDVLELLMEGTKEVAVRAWNEVNNTQPNDLTWNVMGMGNNSWFRVKLNPCKTGRDSIGIKFIHPTQGPGMENVGWMKPPAQIAPKQTEMKEAKSEKDKIKISWDEIRKHNSKESAWIVVRGKVYDCTPFLEEHPGGASSIYMNAGEDCTEDFTDIHSPKAWTMLKPYQIGVVSEEVPQSELMKVEEEQHILSPKRWVNFTVTRTVEVSHDTILIRFSPTENKRETLFKPVSEDQKTTIKKTLGLPTGQHIMVKSVDQDGKSVVRAYTPILSTQEAKEDFSLLVKVYKKTDEYPNGGKMSLILKDLQVGEQLQVKGPLGHITYLSPGVIQNEDKIHKVKKLGFMCGGTGITPAFRIMETILADENDKTQIFLLYANRTPSDILLRKQLDVFAAKHPNKLKIWYTVGKVPDDEDWDYSTGFITEEMVKEHIPSGNDGDCFVGICGPPPMIKFACVPNLLKHGYDEGENSMFGLF